VLEAVCRGSRRSTLTRALDGDGEEEMALIYEWMDEQSIGAVAADALNFVCWSGRLLI